jgi:hypothetical protein
MVLTLCTSQQKARFSSINGFSTNQYFRRKGLTKKKNAFLLKGLKSALKDHSLYCQSVVHFVFLRQCHARPS